MIIYRRRRRRRKGVSDEEKGGKKEKEKALEWVKGGRKRGRKGRWKGGREVEGSEEGGGQREEGMDGRSKPESKLWNKIEIKL